MKSKLIIIVFMTTILISLTGCGNSNTKTLNCSVTNYQDGGSKTSDLEVEIKNGEVKDMTLTLNIELTKNQQSYKQAMIDQIRQKTNQVYSTKNGIKAIFDMNSSYFNTLGISKDVSYSEIKQVLELQGYTCKE